MAVESISGWALGFPGIQCIIPGRGGGGWNRRNLERQNLAQKCARLCCGVLGSACLGVIVSALGMHIPLLPAQFAVQERFDKRVGAAAIRL